jgi:hypothetical protein
MAHWLAQRDAAEPFQEIMRRLITQSLKRRVKRPIGLPFPMVKLTSLCPKNFEPYESYIHFG